MGFRNFIGRLKNRIKGVFKKRLSKGKLKKSPKRIGPKRASEALLPPIFEAPELIAKPQIQENPENSVKALQAIDEFSGVQLSLHTQRAYKKDLEDFFSYIRTQGIWNDWADRVTPILVAQYRMYLLRSKKLSKGSVTRKLAVLKSFYKWSSARGWVSSNPAELVKSFPQTQDSKTGFLSDAEVDRLLNHLSPAGEVGIGSALKKVVVESLLMLAVRRSEAAQMTVGDLEYMDERWNIRIQGKGDRQRILPIPSRLLQTWSEWLPRIGDDTPMGTLEENPAGWMEWCRRNAHQPLLISSRARNTETPLSSSEIARIVRKSSRKAGVVNRVSPHMLRATAITHALDQGATHRGVQQMAGWTSPLMISRYDKRRKDPKYSAILNLKYAQKKGLANSSETRSSPESSVIT